MDQLIYKLMKPLIKRLKNQFYIKYYMRRAGNDSPVIKKEIDDILIKLEKLLK